MEQHALLLLVAAVAVCATTSMASAAAELSVHGRAAGWMRPAGPSSSCGDGTLVEECLDEVRGGDGGGFWLGARRQLVHDGDGYGEAGDDDYPPQYISYAALMRNSVPCSVPGASYYNCHPGAVANPYTRGCSAITQCRDYLASHGQPEQLA